MYEYPARTSNPKTTKGHTMDIKYIVQQPKKFPEWNRLLLNHPLAQHQFYYFYFYYLFITYYFIFTPGKLQCPFWDPLEVGSPRDLFAVRGINVRNLHQPFRFLFSEPPEVAPTARPALVTSLLEVHVRPRPPESFWISGLPIS